MVTASLSNNWACLLTAVIVLVEKPFVPTFGEADELVSIAEKHGKLLTVYQSKPNL